MPRLPQDQRIKTVEFYNQYHSAGLVRSNWIGEDIPDLRFIKHWADHFHEFGGVIDEHRSGRPPAALNEENKQVVLQDPRDQPKESHRKRLFYLGTVDAEAYINVINDIVIPQLEWGGAHRYYYQQDGVSVHYAHLTRNLLDLKFKIRWIRSGGPFEWLQHSPDLIPPDFWLWSYLRNAAYDPPP
ncbi:MAG: hypothetical protein EZS28_040895, partial [Streblomastix strix]